MALVDKVHIQLIQGGSNNTAPFPSLRKQLQVTATFNFYCSYLGMEWCCVITATLYVYFVDECHPYILLISFFILLYFYFFYDTFCKCRAYTTSIGANTKCIYPNKTNNKTEKNKTKQNKNVYNVAIIPLQWYYMYSTSSILLQ